jgi:C4-dicarboxylate transporter DctQ subunit
MKNPLENFEGKIIRFIFPIMCLLIFVATVARITATFTQYLTWTEEVARYLMIWLAFLAVGMAAKENQHFRMSAVVDVLPPRAGKILNAAANLISVAFMVILVYYGVLMIQRLMMSGQTSPILKLPMWIPYLAIPVGVFDMLVRTVIRGVKAVAKTEEGIK